VNPKKVIEFLNLQIQFYEIIRQTFVVNSKELFDFENLKTTYLTANVLSSKEKVTTNQFIMHRSVTEISNL
jgi:hypothetical protein